MANLVEVKVPDIGDFKDVAVIEVLVKPGEVIAVDTGADHARVRQGVDGGAVDAMPGTVKELKVKVGDKVSEGSVDPGGRGRGRPRAAPAPASRARRRRRSRLHRRCGARCPRRPRQLLPARPTSNARCSCSAPAPAATPPRSAAPTSA